VTWEKIKREEEERKKRSDQFKREWKILPHQRKRENPAAEASRWEWWHIHQYTE